MHSLRWHGRGDLRLEEVPEPPEPRPNQAVVEVSYCGVCGTDLHEYTHGPNLLRTQPHPLSGEAAPLALGHEISGVVTALGSDVPGVEVGTRVAVDPCLRCGVCRWCTRGEYHICALGGSLGLAAEGGFASHVTVPVAGLHPVPGEVSDEYAALAEPLAVGLHAVRRAGVQPGDSVLILGAGPIGIAILLFAKLAGASALFVSEPMPARAERAGALGATAVYDPTTADVRREVFLRTGRVGPDIVLEATGRSDATRMGISTVRRGGVAVLAGVSDVDLQVPLGQIVYFERKVLGSLGYNFDIPRVLSLIAEQRLDVSPLLTGTAPLREGIDVFHSLESDRGQHLKVLLNPKGN